MKQLDLFDKEEKKPITFWEALRNDPETVLLVVVGSALLLWGALS
tara:strand:+ start:3905 stop:4039 length:135 start_codon:yes stop_codon:yes gene_type:complete